MNVHKKIIAIMLGFLAAGGASSALACASCGCSLSTDAAAGYSASPGWRMTLEYDYINQDQLRSGTRTISAAQVAALNPGAGQEVEHQTVNRYTNLNISYRPNADWVVGVLVPYVDRYHTTYGAATPDQLTPANLDSSSNASLGDMKLIGSYQGFLPTHNLGLQFGVKLPTGRYGGQNVNTGDVVGRSPVSFVSGDLLDTSLQPGTGSTDLILGGYYYQAISQNFDAFVNGQFQAAVAEKLDQTDVDFRPGNTTTLSFGVRYEENPKWVPQLQINIADKRADQGALADVTDSAGTVAYISPGLTVSVLKTLQFYGFVQVPVYSRLDGYQLFPRWTTSLGVSYGF